MARRRLTPEEESQAIADAIAARDGDAESLPVEAAVAPGSVVLSVRMSERDAKALRSVAKERGDSLSALLLSAVDRLLTSKPPDLYTSRDLRRVMIYGGMSEGVRVESVGSPFEVRRDDPEVQAVSS